MRQLLLAAACVVPFAAAGQTVPIPTKNGLPSGAPAVAGDPLFLAQVMGFFASKQDVDGNISGQHVIVNGTTYTVAQALALPAGGPPTDVVAGGTTQASAAPVNGATVYVVGGAANASLILVAGYLNTRIINTTSVAILVYPPVGGTINVSPANAAVALMPGSAAAFSSADGVAWRAG